MFLQQIWNEVVRDRKWERDSEREKWVRERDSEIEEWVRERGRGERWREKEWVEERVGVFERVTNVGDIKNTRS